MGRWIGGLVVASAAWFNAGQAQDLFFVNGADVYIQSGADVYIYGGLNASGSSALIQNDGTIHLRLDPAAGKENWTNNASANLLTGTGTVYLEADGPQEITGTFPTHFYNLVLAGAGVTEKWLRGVDAYVHGTLDLTNEILYVDTHTMYIVNTAPGALIRTGATAPTFSNALYEGIVVSSHASTTARHKGFLARAVVAGQSYFFPVADTTQATKRFRPVIVHPVNLPSGTQDTIFVRLVNVPPSTDGYDPGRYQRPITGMPDLFYWLIHSNGDNSLRNDSISVFYDHTVDGQYYSGYAHWNPDSPATASHGFGAPSPAWTYWDFDQTPINHTVNNPAGQLSEIHQRFTGRYDPHNVSGQGASWAFALTNEPILPLDYIVLKAVPQNHSIVLRWRVGSEDETVVGYELLRREDAQVEQEVIAWQPAVGQTSYEYEDREVVPGVRYWYQVRGIHDDGSDKFSNVVSAILGGEGFSAMVVSDPFDEGMAFVVLTATEPVQVQLELYDPSGKLVWTQTGLKVHGQKRIPLPTAMLAEGVYPLVVRRQAQGAEPVVLKVLR